MVMEIERYGDVVVASLDDELVTENIGRFEDLVGEAVQEGTQNFVIDFERTEFVDSAGLKSLLDLLATAQSQGGGVRVSGLDRNCRKIFEMTRFDKKFEIFTSLVDGVKSFR